MADEVKIWPISNRAKNALIKAGIENVSGFDNFFLDDLKNIDGLGATGIREVREWLSSKYGIVLKLKPKEKKKVLKNYKSSQEVVTHLLGKTSDWPRQLKIADSLIEKYGSELLLSVQPQAKVYSLLWYKSDYGDKYIRKFMLSKVVVETPEEKEEEAPCSLEIVEVKKPNLKSFLKL